MQAVNVRGTAVVLDAAARTMRRRVVHTSSCATCGPVRGRHGHRARSSARTRTCRALQAHQARRRAPRPTSCTRGRRGDRRQPNRPCRSRRSRAHSDRQDGRRRGARTSPRVPGAERPERRRRRGRRAAGHVAAFERGRPGERYLLGGDNLAMREVFAAIAGAAGQPAPRLPVPWVAAYAVARLADALLRPVGREPQLLVPDEVRAGRLPHLFDDAKARAELGYVSRPGLDALAAAARAVSQRSEPGQAAQTS